MVDRIITNIKLYYAYSSCALWDSPSFFTRQFPGREFGHLAGIFIKEIMDRVIAAVLLVLLAPLMILIVLWIQMDSPGAAIFTQVRVGRNGRLFTMYKFRSMVARAEKLRYSLDGKNETGGLIFKIRSDPRVTRAGRWLRRTSLDELPQLFNVLRGEMSLVGPRPPLPEEVRRYDLFHYRKLAVKQGLTGLWQVSGRSNLPFEEMIRLDMEYIRKWSLWLDLKILFKTVRVMLSGDGAY